MPKNITTEDAEKFGKTLADIFAAEGEAAVQAAFDTFATEQNLTKIAQNMIRKQFKLAAGMETTPLKPDGTLRIEQALAEIKMQGNASTPVPETPEDSALAAVVEPDPSEDASKGEAAAVPEPTLADSEARYGAARMKELLAEGIDTFASELKDGVEDAVARAIFAALLTHSGRKPGVPHPRILKSTCESPVRVVWEIADAALARIGGLPKRSEIVKAAEEAGVATGTARTQHQEWFKARKPEFIAKGWLAE